MRHLAPLVLLLGLAAPAAAQQAAPRTAQDSVLAVVTKLFDGMKTKDTTMMRSLFVPGAQMGGVPTARQPIPFSSIDAWIASVGRSAPGTLLEEELHNPEVRVDDGLATVWTEYTFKIDGKLSHCGFDAFQLARAADGWKILFVSDTRRTTGCRS